MLKAILFWSLALFIASGAGAGPADVVQRAAPAQMSQGTRQAAHPHRLAERFDRLLEKHRLATAGAALIQQGQIAWTGYFGEQAPGVPATRDTLFNVASVAKTVTAELVVRLAHDGTVSLDEPMFPHWIVPDVMDDPRHRQLTPRLALTHRTGVPTSGDVPGQGCGLPPTISSPVSRTTLRS